MKISACTVLLGASVLSAAFFSFSPAALSGETMPVKAGLILAASSTDTPGSKEQPAGFVISREAGRTLLVSGRKRIPIQLPDLQSPEAFTAWGKKIPVRSRVIENSSGPVEKGDRGIPPRRSILGKTPEGSFVIPLEEAVGGYEIWQGLGLLYVARDPSGDPVGFGTFGTMSCEDGSDVKIDVVTIRGEGRRLIWWERPGEVTIPGNTIPAMNSAGEFISFITVSDGSPVSEALSACGSNRQDGFSGLFRLPTGDPIKPGLEKYGKSAETIFFSKFGYEVFGRVRPWSHYMENGDNVLIRRSQRLKVTFKGYFSQNFYVFKSGNPDRTGLISWFSGNTAYSNRSIFVPVEGGYYYSFCSDCPKTQKIQIEWDDSI